MSSLDPQFRSSFDEVIQGMAREGITTIPYSTRRGPLVQAKMWCGSRTWDQAQVMSKILTQARAPKIASLLREEYCCKFPRRTSFLPGQSWHQFGLAADVYCVVNGQAIWGETRSIRETLDKAARSAGANVPSPYSSDKLQVQQSLWAAPLLDAEFADSWEQIEEMLIDVYDL